MSRPPVRDDEALQRAMLRRIQLLERRLISAGGGGGGGGGGPTLLPLPDPLIAHGASSNNISSTAGTFANVTSVAQLSLTPERALWVRVTFTAMGLASTSGGYVGIGVNLTGGVTNAPMNDPITGGVSTWGNSPFGFSTTAQALTGQKLVLLPAGVATFFTFQAIRSVASGTPQVNYPVLRVEPMFWDDTAVPVPTTNAGLTRRLQATSVSLLTTDSTVDFDTLELNSGHWSYDATTKTFTCLVAGQYAIRRSQGFGSIGSGNLDYVVLTLVKNGASWVEGLGRRDSLGGNTAYVEGSTQFRVGDTITGLVRAGQAGGTALTNQYRSWIEIEPVVTAVNQTGMDAVVGAVPGLKMATGSIAMPGSLAVDASINLAVTFPVGLFSAVPVVTAACGNSRITVAPAMNSATKDGITLSASNWSNASMPSGYSLYWIAVGV